MTTLVTAAVVLGLYMLCLFVIGSALRNNAIADVGYGMGVVVAIVGGLLTTTATVTVLILIGLVILWAMRLSLRIYIKNHGKPEDPRYRAWREAWGTHVLIHSFFKVYVVQGIVIYIMATPILLALAYQQTPLTVFVYSGIALWCIGFFFESVGDYQLDRFLRTKPPQGSIMTTGLWRYSRHPNYFGESLMWWGIALSAVSFSPLGVIGFISPILITYLLLYVSGIPLLEARWKDNPQWQAYAQKTSAFFPLPPRN